MNQDDKRQKENDAMVDGLRWAATPEQLDYFAHNLNTIHIFNIDPHDVLMDALNLCDKEMRPAMYEAIRPRLKFKALSLGTYEARIAEKAGAAVTRGHMRVEGSRPAPIQIGELETASATLRCHVCEVRERFEGETPVAALTNARKAGWAKTPHMDEETCPNCQGYERSCTCSNVAGFASPHCEAHGRIVQRA